MVSGSQGALRLPSPLRTARDYFSVMQLKPFVRPLRDGVSPLLTVGYGLLRSRATLDGGCAIL